MINHGRFSLRVIADGRKGARAYVRKQHFDIGAPLSFDAEYQQITALEYVLGAVAGDLVTGFKTLAGKRRVIVDNMEAVIHADLNNPLTYLGVVGEEGHPGIVALTLKVYVDTLVDEATIRALWDETLHRSPLWNTLQSLVRFDFQLVKS